MAGGIYPCKWGELYNPGGDPECDPRDKQTGNELTDSDMEIPESQQDIQDNDCLRHKKWNATKKKCVCGPESSEVINGKRAKVITAVDGRCIPKIKTVWPPDYIKSSDYKVRNYFCSKKYMGDKYSYFHYHTNGYERDVYKRIYNREIGAVRCEKFKQKTNQEKGERAIGGSDYLYLPELPRGWFDNATK